MYPELGQLAEVYELAVPADEVAAAVVAVYSLRSQLVYAGLHLELLVAGCSYEVVEGRQ